MGVFRAQTGGPGERGGGKAAWASRRMQITRTRFRRYILIPVVVAESRAPAERARDAEIRGRIQPLTGRLDNR